MRKFYSSVDFISPSLATLQVGQHPPEKLHDHFSDDLLAQILERLKTGPNRPALIVIDDCVADCGSGAHMPKSLLKCFFNRRNCIQDAAQPDHCELSIIVTSQHFKALPLRARASCTHHLIFKTEVPAQRKAVREELMADLSDYQAEQLMDLAWAEPNSFLMIDAEAPTTRRYWVRFSPVTFE
jgi:hypothetical protein